MSTFQLKKLDTLPVLEIVLLNDKDDPTSLHDLTGVTSVTLHVHLPGGTFSRAMTVDANPLLGVVRYTFLAADWSGTPALEAGSFDMEVEVKGPGLGRLTFPGDGYDELWVRPDIGQA